MGDVGFQISNFEFESMLIEEIFRISHPYGISVCHVIVTSSEFEFEFGGNCFCIKQIWTCGKLPSFLGFLFLFDSTRSKQIRVLGISVIRLGFLPRHHK